MGRAAYDFLVPAPPVFIGGHFLVQERHQHEADNHQQEPRAHLVRGDDRPFVGLVGVAPRGGESSGVLGDPDKERHEEESQQERHFLVRFMRFVIHPRAGVEDDREGEQEQADVGREVVREEVYINQGAEQHREVAAGVIGEFEIEDAPNARDVAAHRRIHEAREKRDAADADQVFLRVGP